MIKVSASFTIDKIAMLKVPQHDLKGYILRELTFSLSKEILKNSELPIPVSNNQGYLVYTTTVGMCSVKELKSLYKMQSELEFIKSYSQKLKLL